MIKNNCIVFLVVVVLVLILGLGLVKVVDMLYYIGGDVVKFLQCVGGDSQKCSVDSYSIFGGYKFNENFVVEVNYIDLGSINFNGINVKNKVYLLDGIVCVLLGVGFGVYGKVGVVYVDCKFDSGLGSEYKIGLKLGVGVDYVLIKNVLLCVEVICFNNMFDVNGFNKKIDCLGVGLVYQF